MPSTYFHMLYIQFRDRWEFIVLVFQIPNSCQFKKFLNKKLEDKSTMLCAMTVIKLKDYVRQKRKAHKYHEF